MGNGSFFSQPTGNIDWKWRRFDCDTVGLQKEEKAKYCHLLLIMIFEHSHSNTTTINNKHIFRVIKAPLDIKWVGKSRYSSSFHNSWYTVHARIKSMGTHILTLYQFISPYEVSSNILSYYLYYLVFKF